MVKKSNFLKLIVSLIVVFIFAIGCSNQTPGDGETDNTSNENPFAKNGDEQIITSMGHGLANPEVDENGERLPLRYDGGELKIDYSVSASGKAKNVGFLVFVDGIPQPYKLNTTETPYEYMHIMDLKEDDKDTPFTFVFTPVTGKQGDSLNVSITSIYNPAFIPDMKETSTYGGYHTTLEALGTLYFEKDPDVLEDSSIPKVDYISKVNLSTEPITKELLEKSGGLQKIDLETLDKQVISQLYFDGDSAMRVDNIQVNDSGTLHVTFKLFGHPGVRYQNTFYINHQAVTAKNGDISYETVLAKGEVVVLDVEIDLKGLEDFNTFYVVSTPTNAVDFPDDVIVLEKSPSILLYK